MSTNFAIEREVNDNKTKTYSLVVMMTTRCFSFLPFDLRAPLGTGFSATLKPTVLLFARPENLNECLFIKFPGSCAIDGAKRTLKNKRH